MPSAPHHMFCALQLHTIWHYTPCRCHYHDGYLLQRMPWIVLIQQWSQIDWVKLVACTKDVIITCHVVGIVAWYIYIYKYKKYIYAYNNCTYIFNINRNLIISLILWQIQCMCSGIFTNQFITVWNGNLNNEIVSFNMYSCVPNNSAVLNNGAGSLSYKIEISLLTHKMAMHCKMKNNRFMSHVILLDLLFL